MFDHYWIARSNGLVDLSPSFGFEIQPEVRILKSNGLGLSRTDPAALDLPVPDRLLSEDLAVVEGDNVIATLNFERLNAVYRFETGSILLGRRAVSLGNFRTLIILNKFAAAPLQAQGYPFYFGQDGATLTYGGPIHQFRGITILGETQKRDVHLLEWKFGVTGFEFQGLVGKWWEHFALGFAPTLDVAGSSFRFEMLTLPEIGMTQAGLGFERALAENLKIGMESLYQSLGIDSPSELTLRSPSPFMIFRSRYIALVQFEYTGFNFINIAAGAARSFSDQSMIGSLRVQYSLSDHFDVYLDSRIPLTQSQGEFSTYSVDLPGGGTLGQNAYVSLGLKSFF